MKEKECDFSIIIHAKTCRKSPLGRPRKRWQGNIKMELREMGFVGVMWLELSQNHAKLPFVIISAEI
jgi:hypothetical protein